MKIALTVNGRPVAGDVTPRTNLADFLREQLLLTGTHVGCEHGICGACTVEIDGEIARSCITYAVACDGSGIRTIEGFDEDALMSRLRQTFTEEHALQCGYCTPGMLIAARDLVRRKGGLSRAEIRTEMSGNLCRCTGYMGIVNAVARVMDERAGFAPSTAPTANGWLGPAPGPGASVAFPDPTPAGGREVSRAAPPPPARPAVARKPVRVTVGDIEDVDGTVRLAQSFVLEHPRQVVWQLMSDPQAVARCMPGASLDGPPRDGNISGRIEVKLGPIAASFAGEGSVKPFPGEYRQLIEGRGGDRRSGSQVSGSVDYRLSATTGEAGGEATRVAVTISYALTGLLAQLGRSAIARDLARRIGETFAQNIDAQLSGAAVAQVPVGGLSLVLQVLAARLRAMLARIFAR
ncbi:MAG: 2Fe-2S iron-sulfur cluster binding domain-containing protein [Hyphomonadaceae bacterium]|nr:2Fe-2S iron-sulfur cluster binding domain-containing protein [Hyphomonadaceae bacterium]